MPTVINKGKLHHFFMTGKKYLEVKKENLGDKILNFITDNTENKT